MSGECSICFDSCRDSVVCPCPGAHAFCRQCLQGIRTLQCPVCRDSSAHVAQWLFHLQMDPAIVEETFFHALEIGSLDMVRLFCQIGADKDKENQKGYTPLVFTAGFGHSDVLRFLCEAGSDKDRRGQEGLVATWTWCTSYAKLGPTRTGRRH